MTCFTIWRTEGGMTPMSQAKKSYDNVITKLIDADFGTSLYFIQLFKTYS